MNFYRELGFLIFGSRLRRLSEYFLSEINGVYAQEGIGFDASWFPVFYLLSKGKAVAIQELAETMIVSHSAASQLVGVLKARGLVKAARSLHDGRKQLIELTPNGDALLQRLIPVWEAINKTMEAKADHRLLEELAVAEDSLLQNPLAADVLKTLHA